LIGSADQRAPWTGRLFAALFIIEAVLATSLDENSDGVACYFPTTIESEARLARKTFGSAFASRAASESNCGLGQRRPLTARDCSLRTGAANAFDGQRRTSGFLRNFPILLDNKAVRGFIFVQAAKQFGRHAPIGAL
jgi:hypothetical protein